MNTTTRPDPTPAQQQAIHATAPTVVTIAGPGSGKTATLVARIIADQERGRRPDHQAAITFTQNSAREMRDRLAQAGAAPIAYIGTLHGFCLDLIRSETGMVAVLDADRAELLMQTVLDDLRLKVSLSKVKDAVAGLGEPPDAKVALARDTYRARLLKAGAVDYDTILVRARDMLLEGYEWKGWDALYVDEYQDSGPLDAEIYSLLNCLSRFVVGDPDQAIYSFRGARMENLMELAGGHDTFVAYLEANFRSGPAVCNAATRLVAHNRNRLVKSTIAAVQKPGHVALLDGTPFDSEMMELAAIVRQVQFYVGQGKQDSTAVLCRYNNTRAAIVDALKASGVPVKEKEEAAPKDWKAAMLTLSLMSDPTNPLTLFFWAADRFGKEAAAKMVRQASGGHAPALGLKLTPYTSPVDLARILSQAGHEKGSIARVMDAAESLGTFHPARLLIALHEGLARKGEVSSAGVSVLTMHGAKGLEFDHVILPAVEEQDLPGMKANAPDTEEARRLFYVAVTRARFTVDISWAKTRTNPYNSKREDRGPSPFITEL